MSLRFAANFVSLIIGAGLVTALFAFSFSTAHWIALGVGAAAIVMALSSFAAAHQGVYQRLADVAICLLGAWAVVAAVVMNNHSIWLIFGAAGGLAILGAIGLIVRELELGRGLQVGETVISPDQFAYISSIQRDAEARR
jgi:hypothetical protein